MADPTPIVAAEVAPMPTPTSVVAPTAVVEPVQTVIAPVAPVVPTALEVAPTPVLEAPAAVVAPVVTTEPPKVETTLLGAEIKPVESLVPGNETPVVPEKTTEGGQSVEPAPPPKYEAFAFPDGLVPNETKVGEFTNFLSKLELDGKADHATVQKVGQELVNFHVNEVKKVAEGAVQNLVQHYQQTWEKQKTDWKDAVVKDPELGGNRLETNVNSIQTFLNTHGGTAEQVAKFRQVMESTGLGNHPDVIRVLFNASQAYKEGTPIAASRPVPEAKSKTSTLYGKMK